MSTDKQSQELKSKSSRFDELKESFFQRMSQLIREENAELLEEHLSMKPLLSVEDLAKTLGVSKRTVETIIEEGELSPIWVRGQRRFHPDSVDAYLRRKSREQ